MKEASEAQAASKGEADGLLEERAAASKELSAAESAVKKLAKQVWLCVRLHRGHNSLRPAESASMGWPVACCRARPI